MVYDDSTNSIADMHLVYYGIKAIKHITLIHYGINCIKDVVLVSFGNNGINIYDVLWY